MHLPKRTLNRSWGPSLENRDGQGALVVLKNSYAEVSM